MDLNRNRKRKQFTFINDTKTNSRWINYVPPKKSCQGEMEKEITLREESGIC